MAGKKSDNSKKRMAEGEANMWSIFRTKPTDNECERAEEINFDNAGAYLLLNYVPEKQYIPPVPPAPKTKTDSKPEAGLYSPPDGNVRFSLSESDSYTALDRFTPGSLFLLAQNMDCGIVKDFPELNGTFTEKLLEHINKKGLKPSAVYKRAGIDKGTFSRLSGNRCYSPTKDTAVALALAAELTVQEAADLLSRAGYTLSHSIKRDVLLEYCFSAQIRNVVTVNCLLDKFECRPLGRSS